MLYTHWRRSFLFQTGHYAAKAIRSSEESCLQLLLNRAVIS